MTRVPDQALDLIARWEGYVPTPYQDVAGVWTIGFGTTTYPDGTPVGPGDSPVSYDQARELMRTYLTGAADTLDAAVAVSLSDEQRAALLDFIYNLGSGAFLASYIPEYINAGQLNEAVAQLKRYVRAGGKVFDALVQRRNEEAALLLTTTAPIPPVQTPVDEEDDVTDFIEVSQAELVEVLNQAAVGSLGAEIGGSVRIKYLVKKNFDNTWDFRIDGIPMSVAVDIDALK